MDPNVALANAQRLAKEIQKLEDEDNSQERLAQLGCELADVFLSLNGWINHGGFLPSQWQRMGRV